MPKLLFVMFLLNFLMLQAQAKICPDAPLPRLKIGEVGEVAPDIDRLNLRALPAVGTGEVRLLYSGNQFEVIGGPSCNGGYSWWRVELSTGETGWVAEGAWDAYYLRPVIDDEARTICNSAQTPWLHLLATAACAFLDAMVATA